MDNCDDVLLAIPFRDFVEKGIMRLEKIAKDFERAREALRYATCELAVRKGRQIYSNSGIDFSNSPGGLVTVPPDDPDAAARALKHRIRKLTGLDVPVIISDTEYWFFLGSLDFARGCSGLRPVARNFGAPDLYGNPKFGGVDAIAHELACAAALLMGQASEGVPVVLVRGYKYEPGEEGISDFVIGPELMAKALGMIIKFSVKVLGPRWALRVLRALILAR